MMPKPAFLITIDTEGDNLWGANTLTTKNALYLARFQDLCEKYAFRPVWLTNYEMALDPAYVEFARDVIKRDVAEVGMHLHAWNNPPLMAITEDDWRHQPYLIEYPVNLMRQKIHYITQLLEDTFARKMVSHRAGRWAFNEIYAALLLEQGYQVDCSVTPKVNWQFIRGAPQGNGGTDYQRFPVEAYYIDPDDISKPGDSSLLEVPMTIQYRHSAFINAVKRGYDRLRGKQRSSSVHWLRPAGNNLASMKQVVRQTLAGGSDYVQYMLHSSEYMPAGSPTFKTADDIERLYDDLQQLFDWLHPQVTGMTLASYAQKKSRQRAAML